jgi:hypothetical protein
MSAFPCASAAAPTTRAGAKELAEDIAENIFKPCRKIETACKRSTLTKGCMTELIILSTPLRIAQDLVGFRNLLELVFRLLVTWVAIRMVFERKLAVGFLDFVFDGIARNAQDLVVILVLHGSVILGQGLEH